MSNFCPEQAGRGGLLFIFACSVVLLLKMMGCFSGCLVSSASGQKLFCEVCSAFKCSFNEFVGEKVVSPSYSSIILAPPPTSYLEMYVLNQQYQLLLTLSAFCF